MRSSIYKTMLLALVFSFYLLPMTAFASSHSEPAEEVILTIEARASLCHCGGQRLESVIENISPVPCPVHGSSCSKCMLIEKRIYYHCSNPSCNDTYYGPVFESYYTCAVK